MVHSNISTFHRLPAGADGKTFVVMPSDKNKNGSLEFDTYARRVAAKLSARGYRPVELAQQQPDYVVFLDYAIDGGKTMTGSTPIIGQTGGGTTYHSGSVMGTGGSAFYSGYSYTPPTYGVVGQAPYSTTVYTRILVLEVLDAPKLLTGTVEKLYETKVVSAGSIGNLPDVVPAMIEAIFKDFPGLSGATRRVSVPLE
jgi:hypothetical protein